MDSQTHQRSQGMPLQVWVVTAVLAASLLLLAVAGYLAWYTATTPFPGLFTEPTLIVNQAGDQSWSGYAAGLHIPDHLIALNGIPLETTTALVRESG
jgi:hypothetical protein